MSKFIKHKSGKKCQLTGKSKMRGWHYSFLRSHFNPTAKRTFEVNLQTIKTVDENGTPLKVKVATSVLKRNPEIKLGLKYCFKKEKRLKGKQKKELLSSLGLLEN